MVSEEWLRVRRECTRRRQLPRCSAFTGTEAVCQPALDKRKSKKACLGQTTHRS